MSHRFRFIGECLSDSEWSLREDELHHIKKVLRLKGGAEVEVTDGTGAWCVGAFEEKNVRVLEAHQQTENQIKSEICVGVLKHHWLEEALPSIVETGISAIHVFAQTHTDKFIFTDKFHARAVKLIENACKQSKQARFPKILVHKDLKTLLSQVSSEYEGVYFNMGQPQSAYDFKFSKTNRFAIVGSEGGLLDQEISLLQERKLTSLRLGDLTLRAYTAAIIGSSIICH